MKGKTVCITGANTGIGFETALELAARGARIIMGSRNMTKGEAARARILQAFPEAQVDFIPLDLESRESIEEFARITVEKSPTIDVLVNNAGLIRMGYETTREGFEMQIGVNHMGHFLLFRRLLGALQAAPEARVLTLSSAAHYIGKLRFESFQGDKVQVKGMQGYAQSKLANTLFAREVARRYPAVRSYSLHPGLVASEFVSPEENGWLFTLGWKLIRPFSLTSRQGAQTTIHLATVTAPPEPNGQFFHRLSRAGSPSPLAKDDELANALWEESERLWRERGVVFTE